MTSLYNHWFINLFHFSHFQFNFLKPIKLYLVNFPPNCPQYNQIMNAKRNHQITFETFYNDHAIRSPDTNHCFMYPKYSSPYSLHAEYHLDSTYCYGEIRQYNPIKDCFLYYANTNPERPLIVPREALSTHDPNNFYKYHTLPPNSFPQTASSLCNIVLS